MLSTSFGTEIFLFSVNHPQLHWILGTDLLVKYAYTDVEITYKQNVLRPYTDIQFWISVEQVTGLMFPPSISTNTWEAPSHRYADTRGCANCSCSALAKSTQSNKSALLVVWSQPSWPCLREEFIWSSPAGKDGGDSKLHHNGNNKQFGDRYIYTAKPCLLCEHLSY